MTAKTCTKCNETKEITAFHKDKTRCDGLQATCKLCRKAHQRTPAGRGSKKVSNQKAWGGFTVAEKSAFNCVVLARRRSDLSSADLYGGLSFTEACAMALPFAKERLRLGALTGVAHHIDHIIPIASGGTHTKENLQVLTAQENITKGATE